MNFSAASNVEIKFCAESDFVTLIATVKNLAFRVSSLVWLIEINKSLILAPRIFESTGWLENIPKSVPESLAAYNEP